MKKSLIAALRGILASINSERNLKIHFLAFISVVIAGFYFKINQLEWVALLIVSTLVISLEMLNTSIEKLCDFNSTEIQPQIKFIKDVAAGAVLFAAIIAVVVGVLVFWKYVF